MANEITVRASIRVANGNLIETFDPGVKTINQTLAGGPAPGCVTIGTSEETLSLSEITTLGWCSFQNIDPTNYVQWGFSTGVYGGRMKPGEIALFRLEPGVTVYMRANTAPCRVVAKVFES